MADHEVKSGAASGAAKPKSDEAKPDEEVKAEDIRPYTTPDGTRILAGPVPSPVGASGKQDVSGELVIGVNPVSRGYTIQGAGFNQVGSVKVGGKDATVTSWDFNRVKGILPDGVNYGDVEVIDGTGQSQKGKIDSPEEVKAKAAKAAAAVAAAAR